MHRDRCDACGVGCERVDMQRFDGPPRERALVELAERQWGFVSLGQLRALGFGDGAVAHRVRLGRLRRLHRARSLDARDTTGHEGIPITTVARTLLDLATTEPASRVERALAQALRLHIYNHAEVLDLATQANGHRGTAPLSRVTAHDPGGRATASKRGSSASSSPPGCRSRWSTNPSRRPTTGSASPTSTGRPTASSSRPTAGRRTPHGPPSKPTAPRTPR
jgi:putative AbiEi antitoxin of type IV toxin-antitoxin system